MSDRLRLFVAVDLPQDVRGALAGWATRVAPDGVQPVRAENLHLTLAFLGSRSQHEADTVAALLPGLARPLDTLSTAGALWLSPRRPTVLTVALACPPQLQALQESVAAALADSIGYEPQQRRFRPHVTVGRVARGARIRSSAEVPDAPALTFCADALTLYRSHTRPGGSRYERLASVASAVPASSPTSRVRRHSVRAP